MGYVWDNAASDHFLCEKSIRQVSMRVATVGRRLARHGEDQGFLFFGNVRLLAPPFAIGEPLSDEFVRHGRSQLGIELLPLFVILISSGSQHRDAMFFQGIILGDFFIGQTFGSGKDDFRSILQGTSQGLGANDFR